MTDNEKRVKEIQKRLLLDYAAALELAKREAERQLYDVFIVDGDGNYRPAPLTLMEPNQ